MPIKTLRQFILLCNTNPDHEFIYTLFEDLCTDDLRDQIYSLATEGNPEPFRSAMHNIGFTDY